MPHMVTLSEPLMPRARWNVALLVSSKNLVQAASVFPPMTMARAMMPPAVRGWLFVSAALVEHWPEGQWVKGGDGGERDSRLRLGNYTPVLVPTMRSNSSLMWMSRSISL